MKKNKKENIVPIKDRIVELEKIVTNKLSSLSGLNSKQLKILSRNINELAELKKPLEFKNPSFFYDLGKVFLPKKL